MKKINRVADIEEEKMRLRIKELELEKGIRHNWKELKDQLRPGTILRNQLKAYSNEAGEKESFITGIINFSMGYLAKKLTETLAGGWNQKTSN